jgi:hypothetical protein
MLESRALDNWYNCWMRIKGPHNSSRGWYQMGKTSHTHQSQLHCNHYHHTRWVDKQSNQHVSTTACNSYTYHLTPHFSVHQNIALPRILQQQRTPTHLHSNTLPHTQHTTNMEVAMWLCVTLLLGLWCSLGLVPNYVVLVMGNEGGSPHHMQGRHTHSLWIGLRKLVVLTLNIHQIFNWG